jgi:RNA-directed DNA polymerase
MSELLPLLTAGTGLSESDVVRIAMNAPQRYKTYDIPKRNGGTRLISQPARELKALQRVLTSEFLCRLPVHESAMAYREGISIRDNALAHVKNGPIFKFDFEEFFPSIRATDWAVYCERENLLRQPRDMWLSTNILFHRSRSGRRLSLAIGAPSSPCLSNVLMRSFDDAISQAVAKDKVTYTRYADDLTFSAKRTGFLNNVEVTLRRTIKNIKNPSLKLNETKTVRATKKYKRFVTGLILANDGQVSIGHDRKRSVRLAMHHYLNGKLDLKEQVRLAGFLAFINDVEPTFFNRLVQKYGAETIVGLKQAKAPKFSEG